MGHGYLTFHHSRPVLLRPPRCARRKRTALPFPEGTKDACHEVIVTWWGEVLTITIGFHWDSDYLFSERRFD